MKKMFVSFGLLLALSGGVQATAIHDVALFNDFTLSANDDGSTGAVSLGFNINYFGSTYSSLYVNNNGNVTFTGPLGTYTPFDLLSTSTPIIAPFFADVDTRGTGSGVVTYGPGTLGGHPAFGINWINVGYYDQHTDKLNSFQLILIDRSDINPGDFDIEFNYDQILWETGDASNGTSGLGGSSARVGWSDGISNAFELPGSGVPGSFLDGGPNALVSNSLNSNVPGRYIFQVRNGQVSGGRGQVPEPATLALLGFGLAGLRLGRRRAAV